MSDNSKINSKATTTTRIPPELLKEIQVLCSLIGTSLQSISNELLMDWRIETLKRFKEEAPEVYERYLENMKCEKARTRKRRKDATAVASSSQSDSSAPSN